MRIVAIETSGRYGSVALLEGGAEAASLLAQTVLTREQRTAQALAPALQKLLAEAGWLGSSVGLLAVAVGPGSFTGLRIGVTTAKAFAYAAGAELVGVNTHIALAAQASVSSNPLWTILDAQRQELFVARFDRAEGASLPLDCDYSIVAQDEWLARLQLGDHVTGPALARLASRLPLGVTAAAEDQWQLTAAAVGEVAWRAYQAGRRDDVWKLLPQYGRASYAEEKRPI